MSPHPLPDPTRASFTHRGHRLVYEVHGSGDRLVVYLHALLLDANINRGIAHLLAARGNRVVLLDLLGHGGSAKPVHASEYRMDLYVDQVVALLDELGAPDAVLAGVSLGANVALLAAAQHPDRVRGLVLEMPVLERATPSAAMLFVPLLIGLHYGSTPLSIVNGLVRRVPRTHVGVLDSLLDAASLTPEQMAAVLHGILVGPVTPTVEQRSSIAAPALILGHRFDLIHPFSDASALAREMPGGRLLHVRSPLEMRVCPSRLITEVAAFVDEVWSPPAATRPERAHRLPVRRSSAAS